MASDGRKKGKEKRDKEKRKNEAVPLYRRPGGVLGIAALAVAVLAGLMALRPRSADFTSWPTKALVRAGDGIGLVHRKRWGWALQAQKTIRDGEVLLSVPYDVVLSVDTIRESEGVGEVLRAHDKALRKIFEGDDGFNEALWQYAVLTVGVISESRKGAQSLWYDWLSTLPKTFRNDLYWKDELECLPSPPRIAHRTRSRNVDTILKFARAVAHRGGEALRGVGRSDVIWGYSAITSRAWIQPPFNIVVTPVIDVTDIRARPSDGQIWRPSPPNALVDFNNATRMVEIISTDPLKRGEFVATTAVYPLTPTDAAGAYGVVYEDFTHILSQLDLSDAGEDCAQRDLFIHRNGSATDHLAKCIARYRHETDEEKAKSTVAKLMKFNANEMLNRWRFSPSDACQEENLRRMPYGEEAVYLVKAHREVFEKVLASY